MKINCDAQVINHQILSQRMAADVDQFVQSGGEIKQLAPCIWKGYNGHFDRAIRTESWTCIEDRRAKILEFIRKNPRCSSFEAHKKLCIFHGYVSADMQHMYKQGLLTRDAICNLFVYSVKATAVQSCE